MCRVSRRPTQRLITLLVLLLAAMPFAVRIMALGPMYVDPVLARTVESRVQEMATREGWLLSDIDLQWVTDESVTLLHRQHIRGPDPMSCFTLSLADASLAPCANI